MKLRDKNLEKKYGDWDKKFKDEPWKHLKKKR